MNEAEILHKIKRARRNYLRQKRLVDAGVRVFVTPGFWQQVERVDNELKEIYKKK